MKRWMGGVGKFNVNIRWKILEVKGGMIKIQDIKDEENIRVISEKVADKHFKYAYCDRRHQKAAI